MNTAPVSDWGTALVSSVAAALAMLMAGIPRIVGFLVIVLIGWFVASAIAAVVATVLRAVRFNDLAQRSGFAGFVRQMGIQRDSAGFLADIAKWFVRLIVLVAAFDALGLPAVSNVLQQFLLWLPNLVVALIVLVIAGLAANALAGLVRGSTAQSGLGNPELLATIARTAVWAFGIVVAVNQIGIATELVNTLFMAIVGAVALALGLAFGLGGRDTAALIVRNWYQSGQRAAPKIRETAERMDLKAADRTESPSRPVADGSPRPTATNSASPAPGALHE